MRSRFKLTYKNKKDIIRLYKRGVKLTEITKKYKINQKTIYYHLHREGILLRLTIKRKKLEITTRIKKKKRNVFFPIRRKKIRRKKNKGKKITKIIVKELDPRKKELLKIQADKINPGKNYKDYFIKEEKKKENKIQGVDFISKIN